VHFLLFYETAPDYLESREAFRSAHLTHAWRAHERGELILGGVLTDPIDAAVLFFRADSPEVVEEFAKSDPYVQNGVVIGWRVRGWTTVIGDDAVNPVRPPGD